MKRIRFVLIFLLIFLITCSAHAVKLSVGLMDFGTELPSTCKVGESFVDTDDALFYFCSSKDTWTTAASPTGITPVDTADEDAAFYPILVDGATGAQETETDGELSYNPSTGLLTIIGIDGSGTISGNLFTPDAADGADIGTADLEFSDIYLADGSIIKGQNDQSATLTSSASTWTASNLASTGTLDVGGASTLSTAITLTHPDDTGSASFVLRADQASDNADIWSMAAIDSATSGDFTINSYESGSYVAKFTLTNTGTLTATQFSGGGDSLTGSSEVVGAGWDGDEGIPTKNNLRDYLVLFDTDLDGDLSDESWTPTGGSLKLDKLTAEPGSLTAGDVYYADYTNWNPSGLGIGKAYYVLYDGANWIPLFDEDGDWYINSIAAAMQGITKAANYTMTAADMNKIVVVTAAADIQILADQCDTATFKWITLKQTGAFEMQVELLDAADDFYLIDGTKVEGSTNELGSAGASGNEITLMCIVANQWWVTGQIGTSVDAGAID